MPETHDFKKYPELSNKELQQLQFASPHKQITEDFTADVVKVHDGDTITLRVEWRDFDFPLRLLGIDAPEMNAGGEEARDWLKGQILGNEVDIVIDANNRVDKYGRLLGHVFYGGLDMSQQLLFLGLATTFDQRREDQLPSLSKQFATKQWF